MRSLVNTVACTILSIDVTGVTCVVEGALLLQIAPVVASRIATALTEGNDVAVDHIVEFISRACDTTIFASEATTIDELDITRKVSIGHFDLHLKCSDLMHGRSLNLIKIISTLKTCSLYKCLAQSSRS